MNYELNDEFIKKIKKIIYKMIKDEFGEECDKCILFGSCARGDYREDSDVDVAIIFNCNRIDAQSKIDRAIDISTSIALEYMANVSFICLPKKEYESKKTWYKFYQNIEKEGIVLDGR